MCVMYFLIFINIVLHVKSYYIELNFLKMLNLEHVLIWLISRYRFKIIS